MNRLHRLIHCRFISMPKRKLLKYFNAWHIRRSIMPRRGDFGRVIFVISAPYASFRKTDAEQLWPA